MSIYTPSGSLPESEAKRLTAIALREVARCEPDTIRALYLTRRADALWHPRDSAVPCDSEYAPAAQCTITRNVLLERVERALRALKDAL